MTVRRSEEAKGSPGSGWVSSFVSFLAHRPWFIQTPWAGFVGFAAGLFMVAIGRGHDFYRGACKDFPEGTTQFRSPYSARLHGIVLFSRWAFFSCYAALLGAAGLYPDGHCWYSGGFSMTGTERIGFRVFWSHWGQPGFLIFFCEMCLVYPSPWGSSPERIDDGAVFQSAVWFQYRLGPLNLLCCFAGVFVGTLVGVLPGIGPVGAMAMLLPVTFSFSPVTAMIILSGIYYGTMYGGSTTSILVNIPGEPSSVMTCLDGYQMALQGRAGPALGICRLRLLYRRHLRVDRPDAHHQSPGRVGR